MKLQERISKKAHSYSKKNVNFFDKTMKKLESKYGQDIPTDVLEKELLKKLSLDEMDFVICRLFVKGDCFFSKKDYIRRV